MPRILTYDVKKTDEGRPVREILKGELRLVAHDIARVKYRTEQGITVNGEPCLASRLLREGDVLAVRLAEEMPDKILPVRGPLEILYEDEDVICLNKPAGMVVHPSHGHFADTLSNYLAAYYIDRGEPHEVRTVGRLDKDTSGGLVFGKSRTACAILAGQTGKEGIQPVRKQYLALARGTFPEEAGEVDAPISREYEEKIRRVVREDGDPARTVYRVRRQYPDYALLQLELATGRTHQIRVHMAHIGHPLVGDPIYGGGEKPGRAALHAWRLTFSSPFTGKHVTVTAPLPPDLLNFL